MPPKRTIKSFFTASSKRSCQHIENETAADDGEVGGKEADKNLGGGLINMEFIFSSSTIFFAPPPPLSDLQIGVRGRLCARVFGNEHARYVCRTKIFDMRLLRT